MDLFTQQKRNRRTTLLLMAVFVALFLLLGGVIDLLYSGPSGLDVSGLPLPVPIFSSIALAMAGIGSAFSYFRGDKAVLRAVAARPLEEERLEERQLRNVVEEMAIASGLPVPALYVIPEDDPNAFATGRSPEHASIAVTEGLLRALDRDELQAVVAHEMAHIRNLDIRTMMIVSVLLGAIVLLADTVGRGGHVRSRRSSGKQGGGHAILMILVLLVAILAPLIARLLAMAVSRTREFEADRSGAEFTRNPLALARALEKLEAHQAPTRRATQGTAHLFIVDPRLSKLNEREGALANLFATHPPIRQRIQRLERMGYGATPASPKAPPARRTKSFRRG